MSFASIAVCHWILGACQRLATVRVRGYFSPMKTAYELIMERLNRESPIPKLTDEQKKQIAELDSLYRARIAELELTLGNQIRQAMGSGDVARAESLRQELAVRRRKLEAELEEKKEAIRKRTQ